jgi:hypothetical protein
MIAYQTLPKGDIAGRSQTKEGIVYHNPIVITPGNFPLTFNLNILFEVVPSIGVLSGFDGISPGGGEPFKATAH